MMSKITLINLLTIIFVGGGIYAYFFGNTQKSAEPQNVQVAKNIEEVVEQVVAEEAVAPQIVTYTDSGFSPSSLTIKKGGVVSFENKSTRNMWVASGMHPSHRNYPGSDIAKCGTKDVGTIFDACKGFGPDASWSFTFSEVGTWKYHDHLNARSFGSITVE